MAKYGILLNDYQLKQYNYKSRLHSPRADGVKWPKFYPGTLKPYNATPQTVPFFSTPSGGKYDLRLSAEWEAYVADINGSAVDEKGHMVISRATKFLLSPPAGWRNKDARADSLGFGGGMVEIIGDKNNAYQIRGMDVSKPPPKIMPFPSHLIHRFTVIRKDNKIVNPAEGIDVFVPVICRGPLYVLKNRVRLL